MTEMIEAEHLEAVAICSPWSTHRRFVEAAMTMNQHVLCEKPFVFDPDRDDSADAAALIDGFARTGLVLMVNQQWPYTLPTFDACYPQARYERGGVRRLAMLLAPGEKGIDMIPNSLPHVISMLLACAPTAGEVVDLSFQQRSPESLDIRFVYGHDQGQVEVHAAFRQAISQPRPAAYAINDCTVARRIDMPSYQMFFEPVTSTLDDIACENTWDINDAQNLVPLEDPLRSLLADFIRCIGPPRVRRNDGPTQLQNVRLVAAIYRAAQAVLVD
jgi:hypothetical protein